MICRSFAIPEGSREGMFRARVAQFLGVAPQPGGCALLTLCDEVPRPGSSLILPPGSQSPLQEGAPAFMVMVRFENEPPPPALPVRDTINNRQGVAEPRFVGGYQTQQGMAWVWVRPVPEGPGIEVG